jgi:hypothetical protein
MKTFEECLAEVHPCVSRLTSDHVANLRRIWDTALEEAKEQERLKELLIDRGRTVSSQVKRVGQEIVTTYDEKEKARPKTFFDTAIGSGMLPPEAFKSSVTKMFVKARDVPDDGKWHTALLWWSHPQALDIRTWIDMEEVTTCELKPVIVEARE